MEDRSSDMEEASSSALWRGYMQPDPCGELLLPKWHCLGIHDVVAHIMLTFVHRYD
jgi:hypothetical protein